MKKLNDGHVLCMDGKWQGKSSILVFLLTRAILMKLEIVEQNVDTYVFVNLSNMQGFKDIKPTAQFTISCQRLRDLQSCDNKTRRLYYCLLHRLTPIFNTTWYQHVLSMLIPADFFLLKSIECW